MASKVMCGSQLSIVDVSVGVSVGGVEAGGSVEVGGP